MNASASSQKTIIKNHRKLFERIKESKWETSGKYMWIKHAWHKIQK